MFVDKQGICIKMHPVVSGIEFNKISQYCKISFKRYLPDKIIGDNKSVSILNSLYDGAYNTENIKCIPLKQFSNYPVEIKSLFKSKCIEFTKK